MRIRPKKTPPLLLAAFGPKMLKLAGEVADGWIPFAHTPESYEKSLNVIKGAAKAVNRSLADFETTLIVPTIVSSYRGEAEKIALKYSKTSLSWSMDNLKLILPETKHPGVRQPYLKQKAYMRTLEELASTLPDAPALRMAIYGTPADCIKRIEEFAKAGCRHFILWVFATPHEDFQQQMRVFSKEIMPSF